jgi:class 3 adenylate cyclase
LKTGSSRGRASFGCLVGLAMFFALCASPSAFAQSVCDTLPDGDTDFDGFEDADECDGITLMPGLEFLDEDGQPVPVVPSCADVSTEAAFCVDPNVPDLFAIIVRSNPSGLPAQLLSFTAADPAEGGLGVSVHLLNASDPMGSRVVSPSDEQKAVRITESRDDPGAALGIANYGSPKQRKLIFYERVEIGRDPQLPNFPQGKILVGDQAVSGRHCVVTQKADGRCFVRDVSRNGTRIDGRRLVPNVEAEIHPGQTLTVGLQTEFVFEDHEDSKQKAGTDDAFGGGATMRVKLEPIQVTVLVGDIHSYTQLVQKAPSRQLQDSVARVFHALEDEMRRHGGMLKEYQGDAIFAYWDSGPNPDHAADACRAALELSHLVPRLAEDPEVWDVPGFLLGMDWSLATGEVVVESIGGDRPTGLSMIGEPVVLAFRLEKLANAETGSIVVAASTAEAASGQFKFVDQGTASVAGFEAPQHYFSLRGESLDEPTGSS